MAFTSTSNPYASLFRPPPVRAAREAEFAPFDEWLPVHAPHFRWDWEHLVCMRKHLARITSGEIDRLGFAVPPQHGKTRSVTVPYPAWRMLRTPGLRCGIGAHTQQYADKISRWVRKLALAAGGVVGEINRANEWCLTNGSTFIAKGVGSSIAGEPLDLFMMDDVFGSRQDADSPAVQEAVYEWYMDDVTPRIQQAGALVLCNTRWGPGDLFGRVLESEERAEWDCVRIPAISETQEERDAVNAAYGLPPGLPDPLTREPGRALCDDRFPLAKLEQKRRIEGVGFDSLYQGHPIPRGGTFFERRWFALVDQLPAGARLIRYWDLAASRKDSACFTAGVLVAKVGAGEAVRYYIVDVIRGRWMPAERNEVMLQTAVADRTRPGFAGTYFEAPVFDKERAAERAVVAKLSGHVVTADRVSGQGSKELRAEPLASAAKGGLVALVAGPWNGAYLTEVEGFPRAAWKDQVDSSSGAFNQHTRPRAAFAV